MNVAWVVLHCNRRIGARERRQLIPHVRFQVPFLGPESQLKSGFACAGLLCRPKGVILVSEAFTEINAGLVIVLASGHKSPVPTTVLEDSDTDPDELAPRYYQCLS